ncbi:MAG: hypothetical protein ACRD1Y_01525 [Terriglobales bacterium]
MTRTTEQLLTWAPLGIGLALILSHHKRLGMAVALVSPATVAMQHPRGTKRALRKFPKAVARASKEAGRNVARGAKEAGKSFGWLAS